MVSVVKTAGIFAWSRGGKKDRARWKSWGGLERLRGWLLFETYPLLEGIPRLPLVYSLRARKPTSS